MEAFKDPKQARIIIAAFLVGAITLAHEITIGRVFGTFFGTSTLTWSGVIASFIIAMGIGYGFGGTLSRHRGVHAHMLGASLVAIVLMPALLEALIMAIALPWWLEFLIGLTLASAPLIMVAATVPSLIDQRRGSKADASSTVLSSDTIGSVVGIVLSGVVLLPLIGVWKSAAVLAVLGAGLALVTRARLWTIPIVIAAIIMYANAPLITPSPFSDIEIRYAPGVVEISYGPSSPQSAMFLARPHVPVYEYSRFFDEYSRNHIDTPGTVLMLGAGGCTHVPMLLDAHPDAEITVVDNNPVVFDICEEHFGISEQDRVTFIVDDARRFLETDTRYDLIVLDTFGSLCTIPEHLITYEFLEEAEDHVAPGGAVFMNTITGSNESERVIEANLAAAFEIEEERWSGRRPGNNVYLLSPGGNDRPTITDDHNPYTLLLSQECLS